MAFSISLLITGCEQATGIVYYGVGGALESAKCALEQPKLTREDGSFIVGDQLDDDRLYGKSSSRNYKFGKNGFYDMWFIDRKKLIKHYLGMYHDSNSSARFKLDPAEQKYLVAPGVVWIKQWDDTFQLTVSRDGGWSWQPLILKDENCASALPLKSSNDVTIIQQGSKLTIKAKAAAKVIDLMEPYVCDNVPEKEIESWIKQHQANVAAVQKAFDEGSPARLKTEVKACQAYFDAAPVSEGDNRRERYLSKINRSDCLADFIPRVKKLKAMVEKKSWPALDKLLDATYFDSDLMKIDPDIIKNPDDVDACPYAIVDLDNAAKKFRNLTEEETCASLEKSLPVPRGNYFPDELLDTLARHRGAPFHFGEVGLQTIFTKALQLGRLDIAETVLKKAGGSFHWCNAIPGRKGLGGREMVRKMWISEDSGRLSLLRSGASSGKDSWFNQDDYVLREEAYRCYMGDTPEAEAVYFRVIENGRWMSGTSLRTAICAVLLMLLASTVLKLPNILPPRARMRIWLFWKKCAPRDGALNRAFFVQVFTYHSLHRHSARSEAKSQNPDAA